MKTSEFLKIVKRDYLAKSYKDFKSDRNKSRFLCIAIKSAGEELEEFSKSTKLMTRIEKALAGHHTVEAWLVRNTHARFYDLTRGNAVYEYRHRWIDSLIEEYETKGD